MTTEDWPRVEELFHDASRLGVAERDKYLARECAGDTTLRREVESLITAFESNRSFMEESLVSEGLRALYGGPAGSLAGSSLGHYKILRMLDGGGMGGEVYLADDCKLERPVALKFISNHYAGDEWAREQMMNEARAVARLEHTHICPVYDVEEIDGHYFIVMQYVEGETLASLMRRERLALERVTALAEQIARALAFAHARGVIHRDVKPQNIMVTAEGQAKVLDFGLAKFVRPQRAEAPGSEDPGQTLHLGDVVGTPAYMSPEQARGEELDFRSDIFSFGVVLYEMLAGRNPFLRDTVEETIAAIRTESPPPLSISTDSMPYALGEIALRCLAKERGRRPESPEQLARELRGLLDTLRPGAARRPRLPWMRRHARSLAAAALALLLLLSSLAVYVSLKRSQIHTLAVLPIINKSDDREADYLSDGLTRTLSDKFSYLPRLKVRLPSVIPPGQSSPADLARVGREMKADEVLSGHIFKQDGSLRLRLGLTRTADATQLWEGTFNLDTANLLPLQDEVTSEVSSKIDLWLVGGEGRLLTRHQTENPEALNLYMRGRRFWSMKKDPENIRAAIDLFYRAVQLDPSFARAYTGLADSYVLATSVAYGPIPTREAMDKARYNARQALELDDSLPEAHTSMGVVRLRFDWDWLEAEREFQRAIKLDPEYAPARYWYANLLAARGRFEESRTQSEAARQFDPYSPTADLNYGRSLYYARRYDEAAAYFRGKLEEKPDSPVFLHSMGYVLLQQGQVDEAIATLEKLHAERPLLAAAALGYAYGRAGKFEDARRMIRELDESSKTDFIPPFEKALVYLGMGMRDEAFPLLEESYELRLPNLANLTVDPIYDDIRTDPRFIDLVRRVNLTP